MKIIKMGNLSIAKNTCPYCDCEYEYNDADIYVGYELTMQYAYVVCPCCGQMNRINTLPPNKFYPPYPAITCYNHIPNIETINSFYQDDIPTHHTYMEENEDGKN